MSETNRETGRQMTIESAMGMLRRANTYLEGCDFKVRCDCGSCWKCMVQTIEAKLDFQSFRMDKMREACHEKDREIASLEEKVKELKELELQKWIKAGKREERAALRLKEANAISDSIALDRDEIFQERDDLQKHLSKCQEMLLEADRRKNEWRERWAKASNAVLGLQADIKKVEAEKSAMEIIECMDCGFKASLWQRDYEPNMIEQHYDVCPAKKWKARCEAARAVEKAFEEKLKEKK